jgi:hypothetical protein
MQIDTNTRFSSTHKRFEFKNEKKKNFFFFFKLFFLLGHFCFDFPFFFFLSINKKKFFFFWNNECFVCFLRRFFAIKLIQTKKTNLMKIKKELFFFVGCFVNELIFFFKLFVESRKGGQTEFENHLTKS